MMSDWKWKDQVYVFDDILPLEAQLEIKNWLLGESFPWQYLPDVTGGGSQDARPAMKHSFFGQGKTNTTQPLDLIHQLLNASLNRLYEETQQKAQYELFNSRAFLQFPLKTISGPEYDAHHIDHVSEHLSILYYVIDADGDTVLFNNTYHPDLRSSAPSPDQLTELQRVSPKQGRVVIFDGYRWHTATQPKTGIRCVINSNIKANS